MLGQGSCVSVEVKETKHCVTLSIATVKPLCYRQKLEVFNFEISGH